MPRKLLVTIGIPTYNRVEFLEKSIKSALEQDYISIEIIISDNASSDKTQNLCNEYVAKYDSIKYVRQPTNVGATENFSFVLQSARGEYFMWLGDDDWIDSSYVSECMKIHTTESSVSLVAGTPIYYRLGIVDHVGKLFELTNSYWMLRVIQYYAKVADNGMFYGVMHTAELREASMPNVMGGDWHLMANIVSLGRARLCSRVSVHRELGGATTSYRKIAHSLGLSRIQAIFPMASIAVGAFENILISGESYKSRGFGSRLVLATIVFLVVFIKPLRGYLGRIRQTFRRHIAIDADK